jgi:hypothetical protein
MTDNSAQKLMEMPTTNIKIGCIELKNKLKQRYSQITDEDLICSDGKKDMMLQALQRKLGKSMDELREIILQLEI